MERALMLVVRDTYKLWASYMRMVAAQAGVPDSYRMVLIFLLRRPGANQKELAAHYGVTTASASQTVKEMGLTGYLRKEVDARDQRRVRLYLTDKGRACAEEIRRNITRADERISALLGREEEESLRRGLDELSSIIEKGLSECCTI